MPITVVVTFYSRGGETERLAHAAAVGAVQARELIRLRRIADPDQAATLARHPKAADSLRRMYNEYVAPREADVLSAAGLIVASPPDVDATAPQWSAYIALLERLHAEGKLAGKAAGVIGHGAAADSFGALLRRLGLTVVAEGDGGDDTERTITLGRSVAAAAAAL